MNNRARQLLRLLLLSFFGLVTGFVIFAYTTFQLSRPVTDGEIVLPELESTVEITYDVGQALKKWSSTFSYKAVVRFTASTDTRSSCP